MNVLLWIQYPTGERDENPSADLCDAMNRYDGVDWATAIALWNELEGDDLEDLRPEIGLSDAAGRILRIVPYSEDKIAATFWHPELKKKFGMFPNDELEYIGSSRLPRSSTKAIIEAFFRSDYDYIQNLFHEYQDEAPDQ